MQHTLVALVQDRPGVLNRAVSLFRRRGFNLDSVVAGRSERPGMSRMTIVVDAEDVEQVVKQLYRLVEVRKVVDVTAEPTIAREIAIAKVHAPAARRAEIAAVAAAFGGRVADVGVGTMIVEITGAPEEVDRLIDAMRPFGLRELTRSGRVAMVRGPATIAPEPDPAPSYAGANGNGIEPAPTTPWLSQADGTA